VLYTSFCRPARSRYNLERRDGSDRVSFGCVASAKVIRDSKCSKCGRIKQKNISYPVAAVWFSTFIVIIHIVSSPFPDEPRTERAYNYDERFAFDVGVCTARNWVYGFYFFIYFFLVCARTEIRSLSQPKAETFAAGYRRYSHIIVYSFL